MAKAKLPEVKSVYEGALKEAANLGKSKEISRKIEDGELSEVRGRETLVLHLTLKAIEETQQTVNKMADFVSDQNAAGFTDAGAKLDGIKADIAALSKSLDDSAKKILDLVSSSTKSINAKADSNTAKVTEEVATTKSSISDKIGNSTSKIVEKLNADTSDILRTIREKSAASLADAKANTEKIEKSVSSLTSGFDKYADHSKEFNKDIGKDVSSLINTTDAVKANTGNINNRMKKLEEDLATVEKNVMDKFVAADASATGHDAHLREVNEALTMDVAEFKKEISSVVEHKFEYVDRQFAALEGHMKVIESLVVDIIKSSRIIAKPETK